jgi:hypothetical protein
MDNVQNCDSYINILSSQIYRWHFHREYDRKSHQWVQSGHLFPHALILHREIISLSVYAQRISNLGRT